MKVKESLRNSNLLKNNQSIQNSFSDSEDESNNDITSIVPILSDLNETAVEMINQDMIEEAFDSLIKAEYIISSLLPSRENSEDSKSADKEGKLKVSSQLEDTFVCTIYYNLACVCQKLSKLEEWTRFL